MNSIEEIFKEITISFTMDDSHGVQHPHNDTLVIWLLIGNFDVGKVLVDTGVR